MKKPNPKTPPEPIKVLARSKDSAEVLIYSDIGDSWFGDGITAKAFADDLKKLGDGIKEINIRINSAGGSVFDGIAIYNTLQRHSARKTVDIDGMALSIASVIAMVGSPVRMAANAMLMIHDPWTMAAGNAADLRKQAELMDEIKNNLVTTYQSKTGHDAETIARWMTEETWMNAEIAAERGFVDDRTGALQIAAHVDRDRFPKAPDWALVSEWKRQDLGPREYALARLNARAMRLKQI